MAKTELAKTPNNQKRQPTKTLAIKTDFTQSKPQTNQNDNFGKPDFGEKLTKPKKPRKFYKLNLPETLPKENKPILKTYKASYEQSRSHETKPIKTNADRNTN